MKDNPSEELKKLEQQLLAVEEEPVSPKKSASSDTFVTRDDEFEAFYQDILKEFGPDTAPQRKTSSTKKAAHKNTYSDQKPLKPKKEKGVRGLVITLCLEVAGIVGIVLWWVLRIL